MKTLIFITLKVLEIALIPLVIFIFYWIGYAYILLTESSIDDYSIGILCIVGLACLCLIAISVIGLIIIIIAIKPWIQTNKKLTEKIYNKIKK